MNMSTLTEFLEARIAEDEQECHHILELVPTPDSSDAKGYDYAYAERVLVECGAKRQIIDLHLAFGSGNEPGARAMWIATGGTLKILAKVYNDHADYQQEWKP